VGHRVLQVAGLHRLDAVQNDQGWMTRNGPCDPLGRNAEHRHLGAGRGCRHHHQGDERAEEELGCHLAAAESCVHRQEQHADHLASRSAAVYRSGAASAVER
jgi:hypothetical protein